MKKRTQADMIEIFNAVHGDRYDYSLVEYRGYNYPVRIICRHHGEFAQKPKHHKYGSNCPLCGDEKIGIKNSLTREEFIAICSKIHNNFYDYSQLVYTTLNDYLDIICPLHGPFKQKGEYHRKGQGCYHCGLIRIGDKSRTTVEEFKRRANLIHSNLYNYDNVTDIKNNKDSITVLCPEHGAFYQVVETHLKGHGCPQCNCFVSNMEKQIADFIEKDLGVQWYKNKSLLWPDELDIYIPSHKFAIEANGNYWHSEKDTVSKKGRDNKYHLNKTEKCSNHGIQLLHIFEDEWKQKSNIVKSIIRNKLGLTENRIFARNCVVKEVDNETKKHFLEANHIQGSAGARVKLGLYYNNELVSIMLFGPSRYHQWELSRFCSKINCNVIGAASKLLNHFIIQHNPDDIVSYADRRISTGHLYERLGFYLDHYNEPSYFYMHKNNYEVRERKSKYRHAAMKYKLANYDPDLDEKTNMENHGYDRIWDCGTIAYLWKKENPVN
jgi:Zn finger protein HypA/HybF involved in hydrogenase expression